MHTLNELYSQFVFQFHKYKLTQTHARTHKMTIVQMVKQQDRKINNAPPPLLHT